MNIMLPLTANCHHRDMYRHSLDMQRHVKIYKEMSSHCVDTSEHGLDMQTNQDMSRQTLTLSKHI